MVVSCTSLQLFLQIFLSAAGVKPGTTAFPSTCSHGMDPALIGVPKLFSVIPPGENHDPATSQ